MTNFNIEQLLPNARDLRVAQVGQLVAAEIYEEEYLAHHSEYTVKDVERRAAMLVAVDNRGVVLGIGSLHDNYDGTGMLEDIATAKSARGQGIGRAIITEIEKIAFDHGISEIVLYPKTGAVGFYHRLDYEFRLGTANDNTMHKIL
ncbi:GNAT family N-acetyltransferase [Candidatus Saccharibacteria bacterium]|nr:GNAT family N-acetyltransferase [Candidatus Saccharibacteria bacterium]